MGDSSDPSVVDLESEQSVDWLRHAREKNNVRPNETVTMQPDIPDAYIETFGHDAFIPPEAAQETAARILTLHEAGDATLDEATETDWRRATQLADGGPVPPGEVVQIAAWFACYDADNHERDAESAAEINHPASDSGWTSRSLRGGDAGDRWATSLAERIRQFREAHDEVSHPLAVTAFLDHYGEQIRTYADYDSDDAD